MSQRAIELPGQSGGVMTIGPRDLPETRERRQHDDDDSGDRDLPELRRDSAFDHDTDEDEEQDL